MLLQGYKAFNEDMTNRYRKVFEEGKIYFVSSEPRFGVQGEGFHFCERLEDTLRYFPGMDEVIQIARVTCLGEYVKCNDEFYEYYDMYSTNKIRIDHILSRKEILDSCVKMSAPGLVRFIQGFRLTKEEIAFFRLAYQNNLAVQKAISYYQEGDHDAFLIPPKQKLKSTMK